MKITDSTPCFAVMGETIIDTVGADGLTHIYGRTLADVQREHPAAIKTTVGEFSVSKAAKQDVAGQWQETTEDKFDEMLNILPPAAALPGYQAFMVGEPWDHHAITGQPRFAAFKQKDGKFYEFSRPMTFQEFKQLKRGGE